MFGTFHVPALTPMPFWVQIYLKEKLFLVLSKLKVAIKMTKKPLLKFNYITYWNLVHIFILNTINMTKGYGRIFLNYITELNTLTTKS